MNKTEQAQQLRLAAELVETGHPFEVKLKGLWERMTYASPIVAIANGNQLRPILATPPDGRPLHNPDNLTAEQVGLGYRLGLQEESANQPHEVWGVDGKWRKATEGAGAFMNYARTYRLPLSVPWPEAKPDPYAALKAAHAAGKVIECITGTDRRWMAIQGEPRWFLPLEDYRIKPEPPAFQLPPPPPGMKWHREDGWKEGDLPQGYRPLTEGEKAMGGFYDAKFTDGTDSWGEQVTDWDVPLLNDLILRTTRPLVFQHKGKEWTYHKPGDPMPCDKEDKVTVIYDDPIKEYTGTPCPADCFEWKNPNGFTPIIGWRYAETTKTVELGPEDVPPGSVIRNDPANAYVAWWDIIMVTVQGVLLGHQEPKIKTYAALLSQGDQINRSIPLTGKWDAKAWEPCSKEVQA